MKYRDLILQENEFTYSSNIQFDVENDKKLMRFIPNETTIGLLKDYFIDITRPISSIHSRILYGSYGTGKSHFLTVLSLLLSKKYSSSVAYESFVNRVEQYDPNLANDINNFVLDDRKKPYLVVPIVFDFNDFERCIYFSLTKALNKAGLNYSFRNTFTQAINQISKWQENNESLTRLEIACSNNQITPELLTERLRLFDKKAEMAFQKVFSEVTYGVQFIADASNIIDTLNEANLIISEQYSGIVFIFDEFGRYIEDNIKEIKVKSIQDLAEYCDHSGNNNHIILVSHKEIGLYTKEYGKKVVNEWMKVEGRYKATPINDKQDQCLSLIKNIIVKEKTNWKKFKEKHNDELNLLYSDAMDFKGFLIKATETTNPFEDCFPLHPITLFSLDKLSKKVAQNERTFFTYLAGKEENSLFSFLNRHELNEFHFVGVDEIYDYFESNIKSVQSDSSYEWFKKFRNSLAKVQSDSDLYEIEVKILKAITIINIINDASTLAANKQTLISILDNDKAEIENAIKQLADKKIIKFSGSYDRYEFYDASIFDVDKLLEEEIQNINNAMVCKTLNNDFINFVLYPHEYNADYKINRVFVPLFTTADDLNKRSFINQLPKYYDGALALVIADKDTNRKEIIKATESLPRTLAVVRFSCEKLEYEVKKYIGILSLETQKSKYIEKDPSFGNEIAYYRAEQYEIVSGLVAQWKTFADDSIEVVYGGETIKIETFKELGEFASNIMYHSFSDTLIVNNELLNKNTISGSMTTAKKNAIKEILKNESVSNFGLAHLSPEYISVRSVLTKNGFYETEEPCETNRLDNGSEPQQKVKEKMESFIKAFQKATVNFEEVYNELKKPPYGLRDGYLSLFFAYLLLPYKKGLTIYSHDVEQEITVDLFEEMIRRPQDYRINISNWSKEQIEYIDSLETLFNEYIDKTLLNKNRLKAIYSGMFMHYKNVSKFSRTTLEYASESVIKYRNLIEKTHYDYSAFFFKHLYGISKDYTSTLELIKHIVDDLNRIPTLLLNDIKKEVCKVISMGSLNDHLALSLCEMYKQTWEMKKNKSYDYYTNIWLEYVSKLQGSESDEDIISTISKALTGLDYRFWNDETKMEFIKRLEEIVHKLSNYEVSTDLRNNESKISIVTSKGVEKSLIFENNELNTISKTMKNKINTMLSQFGLSVTYEEKVQVLLSLLEDCIEGK